MEKSHAYAKYRVVPAAGGNRYHFFCEASGALGCTTNPTRAQTPEEEVRLAWELEGRTHFNRCHKCGRWVLDVMFNADVLQCVDCAPWENKPRFCSRCGCAVDLTDSFCRRCGARLQYSEVDTNAGGTT